MRILPNGELSTSYDDDCPVTREILTRLGDTWSVRILAVLANGALRYNALKRTVDGVTQRMLTRTLRTLERDGLVLRTLVERKPLRVEYELTDVGRSLLGTIKSVARWGEAHRRPVDSADDA